MLGQAGHRHIPKAVVLKPCLPGGERGVLFISFEYQWARLLNVANLDEFASEYTIVVSPTWNPPHCLVNLLFPVLYPDSIFCLISHQKDLATFPNLSSKYRMVPLLASNWVNSALYCPRQKSDRDIDIVVLSNFGAYKRHFVLFAALQHLPKTLRVVLIGTHHGSRTRETILDEARLYGVADRIEVLQGITDAEVNDCLSRARISLILSKREGSCVAVVESMFADTPVGLIQGAHIGSARYVDEATGCFLSEENLAGDIMALLEKSHEMHPREQVLADGIDFAGSTTILNDLLQRSALLNGRPWTRNIAPHHWRPDPQLLDAESKNMERDELARIKARYGLTLGKHTAG